MENNVQNYKDMEKRLTLMNDKEWVNTISSLKAFKFDNEKIYSITYRESRQKNNRNFNFQSVNYVEETNSFIFTSYVSDFNSGKLTDEVRDKITLKDIDLIKLNEKEKTNPNDFFFVN